MSDKRFRIVKEEMPFKGFFNIKKYTLEHTLYNGGWSSQIVREVFHRGNCVAVLLYDPERDEVVIIEQFRAGAILKSSQEEAWLLEIVAGAMEAGETAEDVARREAMEEAGCEVQEMIKIREFFTSPGGTSEYLTLFCGRVDTREVGGVHGVDHEDEDIAVSSLPFEEVWQLLENGRIESAIPIIAIQWLALNRTELRQRWR
ncbi:NUDIX domain-containing protein [Methylophaga sp.]|jgi:ADP-ribose pyrophosphatase|uniref:NUDIX domain-containing protein n=1 Tax=Methylophaga sp. TaxID=2024840 RepID=UPI0013FF2936|nr:NUDIX domain-containing protein [Methylophaga sp.]MTI63987.1 NUDIX domain-containing protein [Methylophaga sp.]